MSLDVRTIPTTPDLPVDELRARVAGTVAVPGTVTYDRLVTPWNVAVQLRPDVALAAQHSGDVVAAVQFAARHGLRVTPQATGHGPIASLVGELLVATAGLDECTVHPEGWARVGAGVKWARVIEAAAEHGLAPLSGSSSDVGVVGYTTGGGLGPMARTHGLASDRVRAIDVVTGDGTLRRATPTEEPELFFGLRGGKGMLGIVTAIEFDLVRQPTFYGGALWFDGAHAEAVVEAWRTWCPPLPEQATTSFALFRVPGCPASRRCSPTGCRWQCGTSGPGIPVRVPTTCRRCATSPRSSSMTWRPSPSPRSTRCTPTRSTRCRSTRWLRPSRTSRPRRPEHCWT